jgi:hypothetical protein
MPNDYNIYCSKNYSQKIFVLYWFLKKVNMKIGIITFWWSEDNYGQILQCYALQKYLKNAGHDAYLIRYYPKNDYVKTPFLKKITHILNPVKVFKFLMTKKKIFYNKKEKMNNPRNFDEFRNQYIKQSEKIYYTYSELVQNPPEADVYAVGSDQVWNFHGNRLIKAKPQLRAFFLNFGNEKVKRIAYAASFGRDTVSDDFLKEIKPLLKKFNYISVREKSGVAICRQGGVNNAEWTPDPTMLLNAEIYRLLYKDNQIRNEYKKPYCLLYILGNECKFSINHIYLWAREKGLEIVYITGNAKHDTYKKLYATIPEWLYIIDNAEYVITNSYHCSVFSLIFQKKFGVICLNGKDSEMNNRFIAIFDLFKMRPRFINNDINIMDTDIDWDKIDDTFYEIHTTYNKKWIDALLNLN